MSIILEIWDNFYVISLQALTNKKQNTRRVYRDSLPPTPCGKFKHIYAYSGIFRQIKTYPHIIRHIQNSGIFRILAHSKPEAYSEPWYIQNFGISRTRDIFRILEYSESEAYSEPYQTSTMERFEKQLSAIIIFASYNCFPNITFSCPLVLEISMIFLIQV